MKIQFSRKEYQTTAVEAVVNCFVGQPKSEGVSYRLDPGKAAGQKQGEMELDRGGFRRRKGALHILPLGSSRRLCDHRTFAPTQPRQGR